MYHLTYISMTVEYLLKEKNCNKHTEIKKK